MYRASTTPLIAAALAATWLSTSVPAAAQDSDPARRLVRLAAGEQTQLLGNSYQANAQTLALVSTSSELVTIAVISGELTQGTARARAGEALVSPIDSHETQRFGFDAARLAATMQPEWAGDTAAPLAEIAARQKRAKFWGRIEPAGLNASAPTGGQVEAVRQSYLGNDTIIALRREAQGQPQALAGLTVRRFAAALAAGDAATVADLIDPKPFTDTGASAPAWQAARLAFARKLTGNAALVRAMAAPADAPGAYTIQLVARDRAMFVSALEPKL